MSVKIITSVMLPQLTEENSSFHGGQCLANLLAVSSIASKVMEGMVSYHIVDYMSVPHILVTDSRASGLQL